MATTPLAKDVSGIPYKIITQDGEGKDVQIPFTSDKELAERFAKALRHAIKLCGGQDKKEAF